MEFLLLIGIESGVFCDVHAVALNRFVAELLEDVGVGAQPVGVGHQALLQHEVDELNQLEVIGLGLAGDSVDLLQALLVRLLMHRNQLLSVELHHQLGLDCRAHRRIV